MDDVTDLNRNNLDRATSPYLRQHADNPVHWQEWSIEILEHARSSGKPILISIGYSTCHWCHVMASEAFSDPEIAKFLNETFVSIKIDREQRPDIDQFMMSFTQAQQGHGGWPLNVICSPDAKPVLGMTYLPIEPRHGLPSFMDVLRRALDYFRQHPGDIPDFRLPKPHTANVMEDKLLRIIHGSFDGQFGGYGIQQKFPHYTTILFLLYWYDFSQDPIAKDLIEDHLDAMMNRGLHDHLQGGFFRYCVDRRWTIPHFEKMLYDQAFMLWAYSLGFRMIGKSTYKDVAEKLVKCLDETFKHDGLYFSAHDADTDHVEGETYLWTEPELVEILSDADFEALNQKYEITDQGNFEGKNHLVKIRDKYIPDVEEKLLEIRKNRPQPFTDRKHITSWNAYTAIGFLMAYRYAGLESGLDRAERILHLLHERHFTGETLAHSSLDGEIQPGEFMEDYASMLLLLTYLHEENGQYTDLIEIYSNGLSKFHTDEGWIEARNNDFQAVPAQDYDQPIPSGISLAELAMLRMEILKDGEYTLQDYKPPVSHDFANISTLIANGRFHVIHSPKKIDWAELPAGTIQVRSETISDCYKTACMEFEDMESLVESLKAENHPDMQI